MNKHLMAILLCGAIAVAGCGGDGSGGESAAEKRAAVDEAYAEVRVKRNIMDSPAERVTITKEFLEKYPASKHTAAALDAIYWYQGTELDDKAGALGYAETLRARIDDPETAVDVDKLMIVCYGEAGKTDRMVELARRLEAEGELGFDDHWNVIEGAVKAEKWQLTREYCTKAGTMVSADAYRREYPARELTDEEVAAAVDLRTGMLLVKDGWARANLGDVDGALVDFAAADEMVPRYYFDIPEYDLYLYWGRTLIMQGDFDAAIDRFALSALVMQNEDALAGLKEAFADARGGGDGFDAWAADLRLEIAPRFDDFEMPDYQGNRHRFSDIQGDVTLLALWFPT
jgi:hypothetical protein